MPFTILMKNPVLPYIHFKSVMHDLKVNVIVLKLSKSLLCLALKYGCNCNDCHRIQMVNVERLKS